MTQNQLRLRDIREQERANKQREALTHQQNVTAISQTDANQAHYERLDAEARRANLEKERMNRMLQTSQSIKNAVDTFKSWNDAILAPAKLVTNLI